MIFYTPDYAPPILGYGISMKDMHFVSDSLGLKKKGWLHDLFFGAGHASFFLKANQRIDKMRGYFWKEDPSFPYTSGASIFEAIKTAGLDPSRLETRIEDDVFSFKFDGTTYPDVPSEQFFNTLLEKDGLNMVDAMWASRYLSIERGETGAIGLQLFREQLLYAKRKFIWSTFHQHTLDIATQPGDKIWSLLPFCYDRCEELAEMCLEKSLEGIDCGVAYPDTIYHSEIFKSALGWAEVGMISVNTFTDEGIVPYKVCGLPPKRRRRESGSKNKDKIRRKTTTKAICAIS